MVVQTMFEIIASDIQYHLLISLEVLLEVKSEGMLFKNYVKELCNGDDRWLN